MLVMKNIILKLFPSLTADTLYGFLLGIFWTLALLLLLILLLVIIWLIIRRNHAVSGITLEAPRGSVFIAASAISDLLYSLDDHFPELEILRIRLIRDGKDLAVQVKVFYSVGDSSMQTLAENFQTKALELLKNAFGIENISRIDLIVPKSKF